jgi:hypothetical protein
MSKGLISIKQNLNNAICYKNNIVNEQVTFILIITFLFIGDPKHAI